MNIADALQKARELTGSDSARLDAELLLAQVLAKPRTFLFGWPEYCLSEEEEDRFQLAISRRAMGEPVAHILQMREFWSLPLEVNNSTLIPRPDTECLVDLALQRLPSSGGRILDLGTGTGAIALALAKECPQAQVIAVDKEAAAVQLAETNRRRLGLGNVEVLQSNWFSAVQGSFDLIVSNPPYIAAGDPHLQQGDVRFEPASALVSGADGLDDIRRIVASAPACLRAGGWLLLEHGWQQGEAVRRLLTEQRFAEVFTAPDLAGNERVSGGRLPEPADQVVRL